MDTKRKNSHLWCAAAGGGSSGRRLGSVVPASCRCRCCPAPPRLERSRDRRGLRRHRHDDRDGYPLASTAAGLPGRLVVDVVGLRGSWSGGPFISVRVGTGTAASRRSALREQAQDAAAPGRAPRALKHPRFVAECRSCCSALVGTPPRPGVLPAATLSAREQVFSRAGGLCRRRGRQHDCALFCTWRSRHIVGCAADPRDHPETARPACARVIFPCSSSAFSCPLGSGRAALRLATPRLMSDRRRSRLPETLALASRPALRLQDRRLRMVVRPSRGSRPLAGGFSAYGLVGRCSLGSAAAGVSLIALPGSGPISGWRGPVLPDAAVSASGSCSPRSGRVARVRLDRSVLGCLPLPRSLEPRSRGS